MRVTCLSTASFPAATICLFAYKFRFYLSNDDFELLGYFLCVARGSAQGILLNMAAVVLPLCRTIVTALRGTFARVVLPLDYSTVMHQWMAMTILVLVILHWGAVRTLPATPGIQARPQLLTRLLLVTSIVA